MIDHFSLKRKTVRRTEVEDLLCWVSGLFLNVQKTSVFLTVKSGVRSLAFMGFQRVILGRVFLTLHS